MSDFLDTLAMDATKTIDSGYPTNMRIKMTISMVPMTFLLSRLKRAPHFL